ncbi:MAG: c-type cytochrome [Chitinophagales bacterium]
MATNESCKHTPLDLGFEDPGITDTTGPPPEPISNCDEDTIYFENDIYPILISNCAISGCHNTESHKDDIILSSYADFMESDIIDIDDPWNSDLIEAVTDDDLDDRMPQDLPPLTDEEINMLVLWQQQGALNNSCTDCDTAEVTYALSIAPILDAYCTGCHDHISPAGFIDLTAYLGTGSNEGVFDVAADGRLYGAINHDAGYEPMPDGGDQLPQCYIDQIRTWIESGFPDN